MFPGGGGRGGGGRGRGREATQPAWMTQQQAPPPPTADQILSDARLQELRYRRMEEEQRKREGDEEQRKRERDNEQQQRKDEEENEERERVRKRLLQREEEEERDRDRKRRLRELDDERERETERRRREESEKPFMPIHGNGNGYGNGYGNGNGNGNRAAGRGKEFTKPAWMTEPKLAGAIDLHGRQPVHRVDDEHSSKRAAASQALPPAGGRGRHATLPAWYPSDPSANLAAVLEQTPHNGSIEQAAKPTATTRAPAAPAPVSKPPITENRQALVQDHVHAPKPNVQPRPQPQPQAVLAAVKIASSSSAASRTINLTGNGASVDQIKASQSKPTPSVAKPPPAAAPAAPVVATTTTTTTTTTAAAIAAAAHQQNAKHTTAKVIGPPIVEKKATTTSDLKFPKAAQAVAFMPEPYPWLDELPSCGDFFSGLTADVDLMDTEDEPLVPLARACDKVKSREKKQMRLVTAFNKTLVTGGLIVDDAPLPPARTLEGEMFQI